MAERTDRGEADRTREIEQMEGEPTAKRPPAGGEGSPTTRDKSRPPADDPGADRPGENR